MRFGVGSKTVKPQEKLLRLAKVGETEETTMNAAASGNKNLPRAKKPLPAPAKSGRSVHERET